MKAISASEVAAAFKAYPPKVRKKLLALRELIFQVAAATAGVGRLEETLKWGEPAYLTPSGSGSTIRIAAIRGEPEQYAMHFNCQSRLIETFRTLFPKTLCFEANRSILLRAGERIPARELRRCISIALTYHRDRKPRRLAKPGRF